MTVFDGVEKKREPLNLRTTSPEDFKDLARRVKELEDEQGLPEGVRTFGSKGFLSRIQGIEVSTVEDSITKVSVLQLRGSNVVVSVIDTEGFRAEGTYRLDPTGGKGHERPNSLLTAMPQSHLQLLGSIAHD